MATCEGRREGNSCFRCGNEGHWANNCPLKINSDGVPSNIPCPYGHGSCFLKVSRSQSNPGRPYYACSLTYHGSGGGGGGGCRFFKWVDQVVNLEGGVKRPRPLPQDYPDCRCGAGKCKLMLDSNAAHYYFICPIEKGHGACNFRKGVDDTQTITPVKSVLNEGDGQVSFDTKRTTYGSDSPGMDNPDPPSLPAGKEREECGDILDLSTNHDMVIGEEELVDLTVEKTLQVSRLKSRTIHLRQSEFLKQISRADPIKQMLGMHILSWLGRLAFPPSRCLLVPQSRPSFGCIFPSFDPIYVSKDVDAIHAEGLNEWPQGQLNAELDTYPQILSQVSSIKNIPGIGEGRDFMGPISKALAEAGFHVQNQLLTILESTDPRNHNSMREAANKTFAVLELLSVDHRAFAERVRKYISCASVLAQIEESSKDQVWLNEKAKFDKISKLQGETMDAIRASDKRHQFLGEEVSRVKEKLAGIENELRHSRMENEELKMQAGKIREDMLESKKKLLEAKAAKKQRNAAKEALEKAMFQLRDSRVSDTWAMAFHWAGPPTANDITQKRDVKEKAKRNL